MAGIAEEETWDTDVYQLETTDPVQGGPEGIDNLPHKALANRTAWLKKTLTEIQTIISQLDQVYAIINHTHDYSNAYLGKTAKAIDSNKLDGKEASEFALVNHSHNFEHLFEGNGYQKLDNGLILQWGELSALGLNTTVTFPTTFPFKVASIQVTLMRNDNSSPSVRQIKTRNNSTFVINTYTSSTDSLLWFAVGY